MSTNTNVFEDARSAFVSRLKAFMDANHPATPVEYDNRISVDRAKQTTPFVSIEVLFNDGEQAALGTTPLARYTGAAHLAIWTKEGTGAKAILQLEGEIASLFKAARFGGVSTKVPRPMPYRTMQDWRIDILRVPFWIDDLV